MKHRQTRRQYPRTVRVNELLREILGEAIERLDDERLGLISVTAVDCEADLRRAKVFIDTLEGPDGDDALLAALAEVRPRLQSAVACQARLKRTPELVFTIDPVVRDADRIDQVLRGLDDLDG